LKGDFGGNYFADFQMPRWFWDVSIQITCQVLQCSQLREYIFRNFVITRGGHSIRAVLTAKTGHLDPVY